MNKWLSRIWEAPQKALAHIVKWVTRAELLTGDTSDSDTHIYTWKLNSGLSLSNHIFLPSASFNKTLWEVLESKWHLDYVHHEYGHTLQSRKLGPVYLLVIGLPSIIWAGCFKWYRKKYNKSYYSFPTERWADKLGGVEREN